MKFIKRFETFDFSQTLPITSKNELTFFYSCDDCNALYKSFNEYDDKCKYCKSTGLEELSEDEWYSTACDRLDEDEIDDLMNQKSSDSESYIDLTNLKQSKVYVD
jgi:hypothetical protein